MLDRQCACFLAHHLRFPHLDAVSLVVAGDDGWMESGMHAVAFAVAFAVSFIMEHNDFMVAY